MRQYLDLMERILADGVEKRDRTGTGTLSVFGHQMRFRLDAGFPLLTTKKLHLTSIVYELVWFLAGDTNIQYLTDHGVHIWDEWADERGGLPPSLNTPSTLMEGPLVSEFWPALLRCHSKRVSLMALALRIFVSLT